MLSWKKYPSSGEGKRSLKSRPNPEKPFLAYLPDSIEVSLRETQQASLSFIYKSLYGEHYMKTIEKQKKNRNTNRAVLEKRSRIVSLFYLRLVKERLLGKKKVRWMHFPAVQRKFGFKQFDRPAFNNLLYKTKCLRQQPNYQTLPEVSSEEFRQFTQKLGLGRSDWLLHQITNNINFEI